MSDAEWVRLEPLLPPRPVMGRPRKDHRPVLKALLWLAQARTLHGGYGAEMRAFRELVRKMREDARRLKVGRF